MNCQSLQMSEWSTTETYTSHPLDLSKRTSKNKVAPHDISSVKGDQNRSNDQKNKR